MSGMKVIDDLLSDLKSDAPVQQIMVGAFCTIVVLDSDPPRCGLTSTLRGEIHNGIPPVPAAGDILKQSAVQLAGLLRSTHTLEASIGMAALNALISIDETRCKEINARDLILEKGAGKNVAIVGHFPFIKNISDIANNCWVLELNPRPGDIPSHQAADFLPRADIVAITATSLINHTFDELVRLCRPDAFVIVLGGSAPLSPVLFELTDKTLGLVDTFLTRKPVPMVASHWLKSALTMQSI